MPNKPVRAAGKAMPAAKELTARIDARANQTIDKATDTAGDLTRMVEVFTSTLRDTLQQMHGGSWRIQIDHALGFVVVAQRSNEPAPIRKASLKGAI